MEDWEKAVLGIGCYIGAVVICNTAQFCDNGVREMVIKDAERGKRFAFMRFLGNWARCAGSLKDLMYTLCTKNNEMQQEPQTEVVQQDNLLQRGYIHNIQYQYEGSQTSNTLSISQRLERLGDIENRIENQSERIFSDNVFSANNVIERNSNIDENAIGRLRNAQQTLQVNREQIRRQVRSISAPSFETIHI